MGVRPALIQVLTVDLAIDPGQNHSDGFSSSQ